MNSALKAILILFALLITVHVLPAQILPANPGPANNGGSTGYAMFLDFIAGSMPIDVTHMKTASTAAAAASFNVEVLTRTGSSLGGPVGSGPGSSMAGWTSLGTVPAVQGPTGSGISELFSIPRITILPGDTVGVALRFTGAGPRYFGTGTPAYSVYTDGNLTLITGDSRSAPFTTTGSFFTSRALVGEVHYAPGGTPGWSRQVSGITTSLYAVKAVTGQIAWAAGAGGKVLRTTNSGNTWLSVGGGNIGTMDLYNIAATSATTAFVTGTPTSPATTFLFRTTNGGTSWDTVYTQAGGFLDAIHMFNADKGIAIGDPIGGKWTVIRTTNGGSSWVRDTANAPVQVSGESGSNNGLAVLDSARFWFTSNSSPPKVYKTTNGGTTWTSGTLPGTATFTAGLAFINAQNGIAGGNNGNAARTTDGGTTWSTVTVGTTGAIYGMAGAGTIDFWATRGTTIQTSNNLGAIWRQDFTDTATGTFEHMSFVTSGNIANGWAVTSTGKIFAYFNPVNSHDIGVASLTRSATEANDIPRHQSFNPADGVELQDADLAMSIGGAEARQIGADDYMDFLMNGGHAYFSVADTARFRAIILNSGTLAESTYQVRFTVDGNTISTSNNSRVLASGGRDTFALVWNSGTVGPHIARAFTLLGSDSKLSNDTASLNFTVSHDVGMWTAMAATPNAISRSCAALIKIGDTSYVYQFGGGAGTQLTSVARLNTQSNIWTSTGFTSIPTGISAGAAVTAGDSNIYVFGHEGGTAALTGYSYRYNVYTNTWKTLAPMTRAVTDMAAVLWRDSLIYLVGGGNGLFTPATSVFVTDTVQVYNLRTDSYATATFYPIKAAMMGYGIFKDTIVATGGWLGAAGTPNTYKGIINPSNPLQIAWTALPAYPLGAVTRMASAVVTRGGGAALLCAGGAINGATLTAKAYYWNYCTSSWAPVDTFGVPRSNMKAAGNGTDVAYVVAGYTTVGVGNTDKFTALSIDGTCNQSGPAPGWTVQTSGTTQALRCVKAVDQLNAWIGGAAGTVLRTTNGGTTWTSVGGGRFGTNTVYAIDALSPTIAFATTSPTGWSHIFRTTNGGTSWDTVHSQANGFIDAIKMYDASNGIAVGDPVDSKWTVLKTTNGGTTWTRIATEPAQVGTEAGYNTSMSTFGTTHVWFGTDNSRIYYTTNGGTTWNFTATTFTAGTGVGFMDASYGVAGGSSGVARTTNGGAAWVPITMPGSGSVYGIVGRGVDFWAERGALVLHSGNRGLTWDTSYAGAIGTFRHLDFVWQGTNVFGWAVTSTGGIAFFNGRLTDVENKPVATAPQEFAIHQNYPNPFNPTTTIRYALREQARVNLSIYNVLGQRIAQLANEVQTAGHYSIVWDGRNEAGAQVASGVYFYRIEATPNNGSAFMSIKKMLLLK